MFNTPWARIFYSMKTRILTLISVLFTLFLLSSCLALTDTGESNKTPGNNQNQEDNYYKLTVNDSQWQIHKSKAVLMSNTEEGTMDYTVAIIAVDASNSITADSKQLRINFNALDLESVVNKNIAGSEDFHILYRPAKQFAAIKFTYDSGIMSITEIGKDYVKLNFSNLKLKYQSAIVGVEEKLSINGSIKCMLK